MKNQKLEQKIKVQAKKLEKLLEKTNVYYTAVAKANLEQSVYWALKAVKVDRRENV